MNKHQRVKLDFFPSDYLRACTEKMRIIEFVEQGHLPVEFFEQIDAVSDLRDEIFFDEALCALWPIHRQWQLHLAHVRDSDARRGRPLGCSSLEPLLGLGIGAGSGRG